MNGEEILASPAWYIVKTEDGRHGFVRAKYILQNNRENPSTLLF